VIDKLAYRLFTLLRLRASRDPLFQGIVVPVDDLIGHYLMATGRFEATQFDALRSLLARPDWRERAKHGRFIDVGANIGLYSVAFSDAFASTLAVEANPQTFLILQANLALRGKGKVTPVCVGASSTAGSTHIHIPLDGNLGQASLESDLVASTKSLPISVKPLDQIVCENPGPNVALLKIDVEGHEEEVLRGAAETLKSDKPLVLFEALQSKDAAACAKLLQEFGYHHFCSFKRDWAEKSGGLKRLIAAWQYGMPVNIRSLDANNPGEDALVCASPGPLS
jgi:FkbM family methyltransferase